MKIISAKTRELAIDYFYKYVDPDYISGADIRFLRGWFQENRMTYYDNGVHFLSFKDLCAEWCIDSNYRETVQCFSVKQIENHFPDLKGMENCQIQSFLRGFCKDYKVTCGGKEYTAEDLYNILVKPDFDPTHGLEYIGF